MSARWLRLGTSVVILAVLAGFAAAPAWATEPESQFSDVEAERYFTEPIGWARRSAIKSSFSCHAPTACSCSGDSA